MNFWLCAEEKWLIEERKGVALSLKLWLKDPFLWSWRRYGKGRWRFQKSVFYSLTSVFLLNYMICVLIFFSLDFILSKV